ncbi:uncharacterized protein LOC129305724 [Prosopis cineraria]|uniref:uncharacterized protein LOC129305724 n=1 Tax=Prosopis cineraria TaxID=364024 RepID=UPI00240F6BA5|nr:uncharacterized protein LOC129305724 [Prosopis cineraria]
MEQSKPSEASVPVTALDRPHHHHDEPKPCPKPPKKRRGPLYFIKVALFLMTSGSGKSKGSTPSDSKSLWRKLVGSVRPLHLQLQQVAEPEAKRPLPAPLTHPSPARTEFSEEALFSPTAGSSQSNSGTPYSSAVGLDEMVQGEQEKEAPEESDAVSEDGDGDRMIDAKAEEFIANFYNEMRLQGKHSVN